MEGPVLPYRVFDKDQRVNHTAIVENKRKVARINRKVLNTHLGSTANGALKTLTSRSYLA